MKKTLMKKMMAGAMAFGIVTTSVFGNISPFTDGLVYATETGTAYATMNVGETTEFEMTAGETNNCYKFTTDSTDAFYTFTLNNYGTSENGVAVRVYSGPELMDSQKIVDINAYEAETSTYNVAREFQPNSNYYVVLEKIYGEDKNVKGSIVVDQYPDDVSDSAEDALMFQVGTEASGYIQNEIDVDFLTFTTDQSDSFYGIEVAAIGTEGSLIYEVYDNSELLESGRIYDDVIDGGRKSDVDLHKKLQPNKTYYIRVAGYSAINNQNPLKYTVKVKKYQDDKGDSLSSATALKTDVSSVRNLNNKEDVEYFTYTTDGSDSFYSMEVAAIGTEGRLIYAVYDNPELLESGRIYDSVVDHGRKDTVNLKKKLQPNKTYYIRVASYSDISGENPLEYSLLVKQYKDDVKDIANSAKTVKVLSKVSAVLQNGADIDFFKITLDKADAFYTFNFQNTTQAQNVYFSIYKDKNCTECVKDGVAYPKSNTTYDLENNLVPGNTYYIKVNRHDDEISNVSYNFKLTQVRDDVKNTGTTAKKISLNNTYSYKIQNKADEDWFMFTTANYTDYMVSCQNITKNAQISIRIYSDKNGVNEIYSKTVYQKSALAGDDRQIKLTPYKTYYIKITGDVASYKMGVSAKGPQNAKVKSTKNSKKKVTVSWSKVNKANGYEIWKATKNGKFKRVKIFTSAKTVSWTDTSVKKGTTYKYKIRAFAKKGKTKYYSAFSAVRSIKVK